MLSDSSPHRRLKTPDAVNYLLTRHGIRVTEYLKHAQA